MVTIVSSNPYLSTVRQIVNKPYLSIIIPVCNEERRLPTCVERLSSWLRISGLSYEIIVVDNGSYDGTLHVCADIARWHNHFHFDVLGVRGKGFAIRHGMLTARGQYRYMCDVDLSTPPEEINRFLEVARTCDVVIGSRELDRIHIMTTKKRRVIGRIFHCLVRGLVPHILDTQCGFKMFTAHAAQDIFERMQIRGLAFDVEALWLAQRLGYSVQEMAVTWVQDKDSRVRLMGDGLQMLTDVLSVPWRHPELGHALAQV